MPADMVKNNIGDTHLREIDECRYFSNPSLALASSLLVNEFSRVAVEDNLLFCDNLKLKSGVE